MTDILQRVDTDPSPEVDAADARREPRRPDPTSRWTDRETGWARLDHLASPLVGLTSRLFAQLHDVDDIRMSGVGAQACDSRWLLGAACNELNGGGAADPRQARAAAIGETVERYSGAYIDTTTLRRATSAQLDAEGVDHVRPEEFTPFAPEQFTVEGFAYSPFTASTSLAWLRGVDLAVGSPLEVPAQLMFLANTALDDNRIGYSTSNGMACGCTWEEAVLSGLLEVVERDAFMATWYGRHSLPLIDPDSSASLREFMARHVEPTGLAVSLVDLSRLVDVPVVLALVRNPHNDVAPLALGAACSTSALTAARKAMIEAFQTRTWSKAEQREGAVIDPGAGFEQIADFDDHVRLSLHPKSIAAAAFLDASSERVGLEDLPAVPDASPGGAIDEIARRLRDQGVRCAACDLTSPDVREAGLVVAKVIAPALSALDSGYAGRMLGGRRLYERAFEVGLSPRKLTFDDLNPWPHPFP